MSKNNLIKAELEILQKLNLDPSSKTLKLEIQTILEKHKPQTNTGYYSFVATTQTSSKIENYSWLIKDKITGEVVDIDSLSTENTFNKSLKKGNFVVSCEVVDEDGLSGSGECEVVVK